MSDANVIDELIVKIAGDFSSLQEAMKSATDISEKGKSKIAGAISTLRSGFDRLGRAALKWVSIAGGVVGSFLSVRGVVNSLNAVDGLAKTADRLGMTTEALAGLRHAANITGVDVGEMETALQRLPRVLDQAIEGSGAAARAFRRLGLDASEIARLKPDQQMKVLADAISGVQGQTEQAAIAMELFGRSGSKMLNLLRQGSGGIQGLADEAAALGLAVSRVDAAKVEIANDAMARFRASLEGVANRVAVALAPLINYLSDQFTAAAKNANGMGDVFDSVVDGMVAGIGVVRSGWEGLMVLWHGSRVAIGNLSVWMWTAIDSMVEAGFWLAEKMSAAFDLQASTGKVAWQAIRFAFDAFVTATMRGFGVIMRGLENLMMETAQAAAYLPGLGEGATEMLLKGANNLARANHNLRTSASDRMEEARGRLNEAAEGLGQAFDRMTGAADAEIQRPDDDIFATMLAEAQRFRDGATEAMDDFFDTMAEKSGSGVDRVVRDFQRHRTEFEQHALELAQLREEQHEDEMSEEERMQSEKERRYQEFLDRMTKADRDALEAQEFLWRSGFRGKMSLASDFFSSLSVLMNTQSRKQFEIGKAAAIAGGIVDTYLAANRAYSAMAGIPVVGPALGAAAAAAAVTAGIANVRAIQAQKFGGGAAPSGGGASAGVSSEGQSAQQQQSPQITEFNVALQGERFSGEQVRGLIGAISEQLDDNAKLRLNVGG